MRSGFWLLRHWLARYPRFGSAVGRSLFWPLSSVLLSRSTLVSIHTTRRTAGLNTSSLDAWWLIHQIGFGLIVPVISILFLSFLIRTSFKKTRGAHPAGCLCWRVALFLLSSLLSLVPTYRYVTRSPILCYCFVLYGISACINQYDADDVERKNICITRSSHFSSIMITKWKQSSNIQV